jgi:hypothetical protein
MENDELTTLCSEADGFVSEGGLAIKEINLYFFLSMQTQVNEIDSDRHQCMSFFEFLEAICRCISKASPGPNHLKWT